MNKKVFQAGIDIGSTTTKLIVLDPETKEILYSEYKRHGAAQVQSVYKALSRFAMQFPDADLRIAMTGSGARPVADYLGIAFVQEVVANSIALQRQYDNVGTAIELGGQDAKMIFFRKDEKTGKINVSDMRMNGSCAGGTGAFIDEVAAILKTPVEEFNALASSGTCVYDISGRCGVYAKTDIQPLLNQGISRQDLALSAFHAISKQTIGGLAQGLDIDSPVVFEGGPLTFNPQLIKVFQERLGLSDEDTLIPENPEMIIAKGAALSLDTLFESEEARDPNELLGLLKNCHIKNVDSDSRLTRPFFETKEEYMEFLDRHKLPDENFYATKVSHKLPYSDVFDTDPANTGHFEPLTINAYLGIDCGSTTTKFVLMDENEELLDSFYSNNEGDPLKVAKDALIRMRDKYLHAGARLNILAACTTGYGELLFNKAFSTECHIVETVAHARAAEKYIGDVSFILDIGGQDMKAIWIDDGIITNIVVNEACSSGCGSFLENFAKSLNIPVTRIAENAFSSKEPAALGSRCTVFMNSSIITEQRNGKQAGDIMAGLCRSIIENVFTKVIRISNLESLGDRIVVQGGTFRNDAVLRAMEQYTGKTVTRAPYPGIMGAIGAALAAKEYYEDNEQSGDPSEGGFIGLDALDDFSYQQESGLTCPFCMNHCKRTVVRFSNGQSWITNNRCEKGEILGDPKDEAVRKQLKETERAKADIPNMFDIREKMLFKEYPYPSLLPERDLTIGIPRVLSYWETMPFWTTFFRSLGFKLKISPKSSRKMYENGLQAVTSDTVCFPAKLVHGHIRSLIDMKVDRIFMPSITTVTSENTEATSESMCAVVKGYPIVIRNSDNPQRRFGIPFDSPLFHWYKKEDRDRQLTKYMDDRFGISPSITRLAVEAADKAQNTFHETILKEGSRIIAKVKAEGSYAVILASRPYQNDSLVNHDLPDMFIKQGIPVLTADSVPGINDVDLKNSRIDIVNNYHARMLSSAVIAASSDHLEYVQIVSFGCGHDAYLSDEIIRLMKEISGKTPLILKLDESDIQGPLGIRVRSFTETIRMRRNLGRKLLIRTLSDPYPVKFTKEDVKEKIVLVPNTSHAFCRVMSAALKKQKIRAIPLEIGREEAIRLGKIYVHNDICFPAQIVIGEVLAALKSGKYDTDICAVGMGKYIGDCRLTHYSALLRKALDDAGFENVPILTNDDADYHNMHPGFKMNLMSALNIAFALPMIDVLEELLRKIRPYELKPGSADRAFQAAMDALIEGLENNGPGGSLIGAANGFKKAISIMKKVKYDRSKPRPTVLIVGEYLLNFHPGANHDIEDYLEKNGLEIIEARMTDVIRKSYYYIDRQILEYKVKKPLDKKMWYFTADNIFNLAHDITDRIAKSHPLYDHAARMQDLVKDSDKIFHHTFDAGEGVLIPGEILHNAKKGCRNFVILQPFGCLPNHVVGRGIARRLKELYPDAQILPLDYDPDVSFANIENRLQMLIMNAVH